MRNYFTLGGVNSTSMGVYLNGRAVFSSPSREINFISVPGRNGDLIGLPTRLQNGVLVYEEAYIFQNFSSNIVALRNLLLSTVAYRRLIDTYNPDEYRLVTFAGPLEVDVTARLNAGRFSLQFQAMPQRFLLSGDTVTELTATGSISNPTAFPAKPLLRVYGKGNLGIGSQTLTIASDYPNSYIDIDCERMVGFYGTTNCNAYLSSSGIDFPVLAPGSNAISLGSGITKVQITPRWWRV